MTKTFFIVIPYSQAPLQGKDGILGKILPGGKSSAEKKQENFEEQRTQLAQRVSVIEQGLIRCGLRVVQLGTEEITELFYKIFNPGETEKPIKIA